MKGLKIIYLLLALAPSICIAQKAKTDREMAGLRGSVKAIQELNPCFGDTTKGRCVNKNITRYNEQGQELTALYFTQDGTILDSLIFKYNQNGKLLEKGAYTPIMGYHTEYVQTYDSLGRLQQRIRYGLMKDETERENFDIKGRKTSTIFSDSSKDVYTYFPKRSRRSEKYFGPHNLAGNAIFKYDKAGNEIKTVFYKFNSRKREIYTNKYDKKSNCIEEIDYSGEGEIIIHVSTKYNEYNDSVEQTFYKPDGTIKFKRQFDYEYDEKGNWIKRNDTTRIIEYYP